MMHAMLRFPVALALALLAACQPAGWRQDAPNILVILADDLGYNDLSYNGATEIKTPNIDRLARQGVVFANGYAAHPLCSPSRAGLMTGRHPSRFGMETNLAYAPADPQHGLPLQEPILAAQLKQAGYRTGMLGKWHLGAAPPFHPLNRGFDFYYGFLGGGHDYYHVDATAYAVDEYRAPLGQQRGMTGFSGYLTDRLTDQAIAFATADRQQPFYLHLAYNAPHAPLQAPEPLVRKYRGIKDEKRRSYLAMVDSLDQNIGRLMRALQSSGQWHNSLIFFLSDNGGHLEGADNSPLRLGKPSLHEGGIRVPFLASWPARWPHGEVFEPLVSGLDIAATALGLAGIEAERPLDGVNLDPFLRGVASGPPREALFWRLLGGDASQPSASFAVRSGDLKLVKDHLGGRPGLFDLRTDPGERRNLMAADPEASERLAGLWNEWNLGNAPAQLFPWMSDYQRAMQRAHGKLHYSMLERQQATPVFQIGKPPLKREAAPPLAPTGLKAVAGPGSIAVSWDEAGDPGVIGYQIRWKTAPDGGWRNWQGIEFWWESSHRLAGLRNGIAHLVQLRARTVGGWGPPAEASATPEARKR